MKWSVKGSVPLGILAAVLALAGCGGSGGTQSITVQPAATYKIVNFRPSQPVPAGKPVRRLVPDRATRRHAAHEVQDRARARTRAST